MASERAHDPGQRVDVRAVQNHRDAERLNDLDYVMYCHEEARKLFEALMAKRWPSLGVNRTPRRRVA